MSPACLFLNGKEITFWNLNGWSFSPESWRDTFLSFDFESDALPHIHFGQSSARVKAEIKRDFPSKRDGKWTSTYLFSGPFPFVPSANKHNVCSKTTSWIILLSIHIVLYRRLPPRQAWRGVQQSVHHRKEARMGSFLDGVARFRQVRISWFVLRTVCLGVSETYVLECLVLFHFAPSSCLFFITPHF